MKKNVGLGFRYLIIWDFLSFPTKKWGLIYFSHIAPVYNISKQYF